MKNPHLNILAIDDEAEDRFLLERLLRRVGVRSGNLRFLSSGNEAIAYLQGDGQFADRALYPFPQIIVTDLKMPLGDGFSVLEFIKTRPLTKVIPTLILSGSADTDDVKRAYEMGASCYLQKRADSAEMERILKLFLDFWAECDIPRIDSEGRQTRTESSGKLGERFGQME